MQALVIRPRGSTEIINPVVLPVKNQLLSRDTSYNARPALAPDAHAH
jgi:hypothetical protein